MIEGYMTPARFRALREAAGVSQAECARMMRVTPQALCRFELDRARWWPVAQWKVYRVADWLAEKAREVA